VLLAHIARLRGRTVEERLFSVWGGKPTTKWLQHRDAHLDPHTKARYHACLAQCIPGWKAPTPQAEHKRPSEADASYDSAARWLRERTRGEGRFPIVFHENVSYGFRRNLYGLRPIGISLTLMAVGLNVVLLQRHSSLFALSQLPIVGIAALIFCVLALITWIAVVRSTWVLDASNAYARALLACCDPLADDSNAARPA
jgi:hypothetical protein